MPLAQSSITSCSTRVVIAVLRADDELAKMRCSILSLSTSLRACAHRASACERQCATAPVAFGGGGRLSGPERFRWRRVSCTHRSSSGT
eukprot:1891890-Prymnesium_polylepis.1